MKLVTLKSHVHNVKKGTYTSILWERDAKTKKGCTDCVKKRVRATVRLGMNYENLSIVKAGRATGKMPTVSAGLTWGTWSEYPYFIKHTPKNSVETTYLRAYLGKGSNMQTEWYLNGRKVDKSAIAHLVLASELKETPIIDSTPITLKINDILAIG